MSWIELLHNLAILVALGVAASFLAYRTNNRGSGAVIQGLLFGTTALVGMMQPFVLAPGIIFDGRSVILSLCAFFFGPFAALIATTLAAVARALIGGSGAFTGILVSIASAFIGLFGYYWWRRGDWKGDPGTLVLRRLFLLGLVTHLCMALLMFTLPGGHGWQVLRQIGFIIVGVYPLATVLLGMTIWSLISLADFRRKVRRLLRDLTGKNKEMETMLYVVSHDLRSPLVNIFGFSDRIKSLLRDIGEKFDRKASLEEICAVAEPALKREIPEAFSYIDSSARRIERLIDSLLHLSRAGRSPYHPQTVDMNKVASRVVATFYSLITREAARVECKKLPSCWADEHDMEQILSNLFENALKYRDPARPLVITVEGEESKEEKEAVFCVADTARGIASQDVSLIWQTFLRTAPEDDSRGEGLGLAIVKRLVERNHGRVWVESELGKGSRFSFAVPTTSRYHEGNH